MSHQQMKGWDTLHQGFLQGRERESVPLGICTATSDLVKKHSHWSQRSSEIKNSLIIKDLEDSM